MFGRLADFGKLKLVNLIVVEHIVESECKTAFESCRRRKSGTQGYISGENGIKTVDNTATLDYLAAYTEYIAGPLLLGCVLLVEAKLGILVDVDGEYTYLVGTVGLHLGHNYFIYRAGEYEAAVVVGMFADKVDTSGRCVKCAGSAEAIRKHFADVLFHVHDVRSCFIGLRINSIGLSKAR